ncbi:MAG: helix-turn-helix domain-containing protein [bacterium]
MAQKALRRARSGVAEVPGCVAWARLPHRACLGWSTVSLSLLQTLLPPPSSHRFRSDDLDEVRAFVGRTDGEHSRVVHGDGSLACCYSWLQGEIVAMGWAGVGLGQTVRGAVREPVLHVPIDQRSAYRYGRCQALVGPGSGMFVAPGREFTRESEPGSMLAISVNWQALTREISTRRADAEVDWHFRMRAMQPDCFDGGDFAAAVADLAQALAVTSERGRRLFSEQRVISRLTDLLLRESAIARVALMSAKRFTDQEGWIEAHLEEPVSLGRLCEVAGVGDRCLQLTFEAHRGMSPMRFVAERRMAAVHRRLRAASPTTDVTSIATRYGFSHLGRFAAEYRKVFGESPSQTLRRSVRPVLHDRVDASAPPV